MKLLNETVIATMCGDSDAGRVVGRSLRSLRELVGLTQHDMAELLKVGQAAISKIEHRGDVQISTLQKYVEALGGKLVIQAAFAATKEHLYIGNTYQNLDSDYTQLVLPIFNEESDETKRDVVLSIRPQYTDKIIEGKKTVELRRRFPESVKKGMIAYIYSTSPVRALVGCAMINRVVKLPVPSIWKTYNKHAFIKKEDFDSYFTGVEFGYALELENAERLPRELKLSELRERFGFEPPQSFQYAKPELLRAIKNEYSEVPH